MKINFTIVSLTFSYNIKTLFLYKIQIFYLSSLFSQIPTQSPIKDKNMKEERGKRNVYIKIMCKTPKMVPYTLGNTVTTLEG
jgi:hypothetical protein